MKLILSRRLVNNMINNVVKSSLILKNTLETSKVKPINDLNKEFNKIKDIPEFNEISTKPIVFGKVFRGYRNEDNLIFDLNDEAIIWSFNKATEILEQLSRPLIHSVDSLYRLGNLYDNFMNKASEDFKEEFEVPSKGEIKEVDLSTASKTKIKLEPDWFLEQRKEEESRNILLNDEKETTLVLYDIIAKKGKNGIQIEILTYTQKSLFSYIVNKKQSIEYVSKALEIPTSLIEAILNLYNIKAPSTVVS